MVLRIARIGATTNDMVVARSTMAFIFFIKKKRTVLVPTSVISSQKLYCRWVLVVFDKRLNDVRSDLGNASSKVMVVESMVQNAATAMMG